MRAQYLAFPVYHGCDLPFWLSVLFPFLFLFSDRWLLQTYILLETVKRSLFAGGTGIDFCCHRVMLC